MSSVRLVAVHYHILKNAGSTMEEILEQSFHERLARLDPPDRDGVIGPGELLAFVRDNPRIAAVTSHCIRYPLPRDPGILFFDICFLRDPLDRVRSMYDYFRKRPAAGDPVSDLANSVTLGAFLAGMVERHALQVRDVQVNLIAAAGDSDEPTATDLEIATRRMMNASFLGVVDRFDESVAAGEHFLRAVFPTLNCARRPVNVSRGLEGTLESRKAQMREACGPAVFEELLRLTALDSILLERARGEVRRRLGLVQPFERPEPDVRRPVETRVSPLKNLPHLRSLLRTPLFDPGHYGGSLWHYVTSGSGRDPHALFDTAFYLERNPAAAASGMNPLAHYLAIGQGKRLSPHPWFDPVFYLERNPDVAAAGLNPLEHYVTSGYRENRKPHPWFQPDYYLEQFPDAGNPLVHYVATRLGRPHRLLDNAPAIPPPVPPQSAIMVDDIPLDPRSANRFCRALNPSQIDMDS